MSDVTKPRPEAFVSVFGVISARGRAMGDDSNLPAVRVPQHSVQYRPALSVARQLGATTYVETSARASSKGVKDAFEVAALAALGKLNKQPGKQQQKVGRSKSKRDLKAELKGRAKSCCVM
ncbi:unnamed protein product [Plutella xylostella]|uniref:(diamondback moth) hypothetical protein n=1 Tax=Plutella xylostella TaxID=51655 RepID=A0A8S4FTB4_PLUXY|nr:unnamed protein product [Plutella xylostella]